MEIRDAWRGIKHSEIKDPWVAKTLVNIDTTAKQNISPWDSVRNPWLEKPAAAPSNIVQAKMNDPHQINSVLDIIFNEAALQKEYKSKGLKARAQAVGDMVSKQYLNPMKAGRWDIVGMNTLTNLEESVDWLGNLVKALTTPYINNGADQVSYEYAEAALSAVATDNCYTSVAADGAKTYQALINNTLVSFTSEDLEFYERIVNSGRTVNYADLSTSERLKSAIGIGEYGRINYEYATGNTFADIVLEIVSDPDTWITFGSSSVAKSSTDAIIDGSADVIRLIERELLSNATDDVAKKLVQTQMKVLAEAMTNKAMVREALESAAVKSANILSNSADKQWVETFLGAVVKSGKMYDTFAVETLADALTVSMKSKGLLPGVDAITARQMSDILQRSVGTAVNRTTLQTLRVLDAANHGADAVTKALAVAALSPSGIYPTWQLIKNGAPAVGRWVNKVLTHASEIHNNQLGKRSIISYFDGLDIDVKAKETIRLALADDEALLRLYREPQYITQFYMQFSVDQVVLGDLFMRYADDLDAEQLKVAVLEYLKRAHHGIESLDDVVQIAKNAQAHLAAGTGTSDVVLDEYVKYISDISEYLAPELTTEAVERAQKIKRVTEVYSIIEELPNGFDNQFRQVHDKAAAKLFNAGDNWYAVVNDVVDEFRAAALIIKEEALVAHAGRLTTLLGLSDELDVTIRDFIDHTAYELDQWFTDYIEDGIIDRVLSAEHRKQALRAFVDTGNIALRPVIAEGATDSLLTALDAYTTIGTSSGATKFRSTTTMQAILEKVGSYSGSYEQIRHIIDEAEKLMPQPTKLIGVGSSAAPLEKIRNNPQIAKAVESLNAGKEAKDLVDIADLTPARVLSKLPEDADLVRFLAANRLPDYLQMSLEDWANTPLGHETYATNWFRAVTALEDHFATLMETANLPVGAQDNLLSLATQKEISKIFNDLVKNNGGRVPSNEVIDAALGPDLARFYHIATDGVEEMLRKNPTRLSFMLELERMKAARVDKTHSAKGVELVEQDVKVLLSRLNFMLNDTFSYDGSKTVDLYNVGETLITIKNEQLSNFAALTRDPNMVTPMTELKAGPVRQLLMNSGNAAAQNIPLIADRFYANQALINTLSTLPISTEARMGVLASIQRMYNVPPDKLLAELDRYVDELAYNAESYIRNSKRPRELLSLDYIRNTRTAEYQEYRAALGLPAFTIESAHDAREDVIATMFVFNDLAERGEPVAQAYRDQGYRFVVVDAETQNAIADAAANPVHQWSTMVLQDNAILSQETVALAPEAMESVLPAPGFLQKLGMTPSEYVQARAKDCLSQEDLVMAQLHVMYKAVEGTWDEAAHMNKVVLVTQNGEAFDLAILKDQIKEYKLEARMQEEGIPVKFLEQVHSYDTLQYNQIMSKAFTISESTREELRKVLYGYAETMGDLGATKLFSAPSSFELLEAIEVLRDLGTTASARKMQNLGVASGGVGNLPELNALIEQFQGALLVYSDLGDTNSVLRNDPFAMSTMKNVINMNSVSSMPQEIQERWLAYLKSIMPEDKFNELYKGTQNITPSMLLGAGEDYQALAFNYFYNKDVVDDFFLYDKANPYLPKFDVMRRQKTAKAMQRIRDHVVYPELYLPYHAEILEAIKKLQKQPEFAYLRALRLDSGNVQQDYAVLRYMYLRVQYGKSPLKIKEVMSPELLDIVRMPLNRADWNGMNRYAKLLEEGRLANVSLQYAAQTQAMLALEQSIDQMGTYLDQSDLWIASKQLQARQARETAEMLRTLHQMANPKVVGREFAFAFRNRVTDFTTKLKTKLRNDFLGQSADSVLGWLAESHGFVVASVADLGDTTAILQKFQGAEFMERNIRATIKDGQLWVWLTPEAQWTAYLDNESGKIAFSVNGNTLQSYQWRTFEDSVEEVLLPGTADKTLVGQFNKAHEQLRFLTDGRSDGSLFDSFQVDQIAEVYAAMPSEMQQSFYNMDHLRRGEMWHNAQFNHSVLGPGQTAVPTYSSDLFSSLGNAMEHNIKNGNTAYTYTSALLDEVGGIANTEIGRLAQESPDEVFQYLKKHPEVVLVIPEASNKGKLGVRVTEVVIKRPEDLQYALAHNARLMTSTVFNKLYEVLNNNIYSGTRIAIWQSILRMYKVGYLTTPGTWARNGYDAFLKNMLVADENPTATAKAYRAALQDLSSYNDILEQLYKIGNGKLPDHPLVEAFFKGYPNMSLERFDYINDFAMTAASGGEVTIYSKMHRQQQKNYLNSLLANGGVSAEAVQSAEQKRAFQHMTSTMLYPMGLVERVSRLAEFDMLTAKGFNKSYAVDIVEKTHFSYDTKSPIEQTMELIIPFYTFMSRNFEFWSDMLEMNPSYLALMRDVIEPAWDLEQYNPDELVDNTSLNNQVMNGNMRLGDTDYYLNTSFSFMDVIGLLTDPLDSLKDSVFLPVQTVLNAVIQQMSNSTYTDGNAALSEWLQNTFGSLPTEAQIRDKYGEWADTYMELNSHSVYGRTKITDAQRLVNILNYVPIIGATLSRFIKTGAYYDDENFLGQLAYLTSMAGKARLWEYTNEQPSPVARREKARIKINALLQDSTEAKEVWESLLAQYGVAGKSLYSLDGDMLDRLWRAFRDSYEKVNVRLYEALQQDDVSIWMYTRLKAAMGYSGVSMKDLPAEVREAILAIMQGEAPMVDVMPLLQDGDSLRTMWDMLAIKFNVSRNFDDIPQETLNEMYFEVARGAVAVSSIMGMLSEDESTRYSYAVAKNKLGLSGLKLSQLPADALELIEHAMVTKYYGTGRKSPGSKAYGQKPRAAGTTSRRRVYHKDTHVAAAGTGLYNTKKAVHANYGHRKAQHEFGDMVKKHYTKNGTRRMQLRMLGVSPQNMKHRVKDLFYYYK